jgi:hypothetical protein
MEQQPETNAASEEAQATEREIHKFRWINAIVEHRKRVDLPPLSDANLNYMYDQWQYQRRRLHARASAEHEEEKPQPTMEIEAVFGYHQGSAGISDLIAHFAGQTLLMGNRMLEGPSERPFGVHIMSERWSKKVNKNSKTDIPDVCDQIKKFVTEVGERGIVFVNVYSYDNQGSAQTHVRLRNFVYNKPHFTCLMSLFICQFLVGPFNVVSQNNGSCIKVDILLHCSSKMADLLQRLREQFPQSEFRLSVGNPPTVHWKSGDWWAKLCIHNIPTSECTTCDYICKHVLRAGFWCHRCRNQHEAV